MLVKGLPTIVLVFSTLVHFASPMHGSHGLSFSAEELDSIFGALGCIEGVIVSMPAGPSVMPSNTLPLQANNAQVLLANESEDGSRTMHMTSTNNNNGSSNIVATKEKTPMCLVNELARFNKIQHQYRLTNEQGPAHKKCFTVTLKLGDEEYSSEGASIKKAQHSAAADALTRTQYKHPPPKTSKNVRIGKSNITPTVELNALAMKRGEPAVYSLIEPAAQALYVNPQNYSTFRGCYAPQQRYYNKGQVPGFQPPVFVILLRVGNREFCGEGPTAQAARHDAASKAVQQLKQLPSPGEAPSCEVQADAGANVTVDVDGSDLKSPISLVHELALKRNLAVMFEVISEKGPPHMRNFTTKCIVGDKITTGEGNGKKISKKRAAEKMLDELRLLPPCSPSIMVPNNRLNKRKQNPGKKKSRNLIKVYHQEQKSDMDYGDDINPISRLIQIQQAKKEREPVYSLLEERGVPRRREFVMEVSVGGCSATGIGPNKKLAKRAAAEALLIQLGYGPGSTGAAKSPVGKPHDVQEEKNRKVTFQEEDKPVEVPSPGGSGGRQLVPGILLMADNSNSSTKSSGVNLQTTAVIAKELLNGGSSPTADAIAKHQTKTTTKPVQPSNQAVRPKEQLMYLGDLLGFQIQFSDFPKGNHSEYLSLVSLSTDPPQVCHGAGTTTDMSHDQAALKALTALAEMGLDAVKTEQQGAGDHVHVISTLTQQK